MHRYMDPFKEDHLKYQKIYGNYYFYKYLSSSNTAENGNFLFGIVRYEISLKLLYEGQVSELVE